MLAVIKAPPHTRTALQRVSRCKRRRAAAHNPRRLPKSVRGLITGESKKKQKKVRKLEFSLKTEEGALRSEFKPKFAVIKWISGQHFQFFQNLVSFHLKLQF